VIFFCILALFKKNQEMNPAETYFQDLALSSGAGPVGATHEGVVHCALARVMGQAHARLPTLASVAPSRMA
jgi:hypothetical protein